MASIATNIDLSGRVRSFLPRDGPVPRPRTSRGGVAPPPPSTVRRGISQARRARLVALRDKEASKGRQMFFGLPPGDRAAVFEHHEQMPSQFYVERQETGPGVPYQPLEANRGGRLSVSRGGAVARRATPSRGGAQTSAVQNGADAATAQAEPTRDDPQLPRPDEVDPDVVYSDSEADSDDDDDVDDWEHVTWYADLMQRRDMALREQQRLEQMRQHKANLDAQVALAQSLKAIEAERQRQHELEQEALRARWRDEQQDALRKQREAMLALKADRDAFLQQQRQIHEERETRRKEAEAAQLRELQSELEREKREQAANRKEWVESMRHVWGELAESQQFAKTKLIFEERRQPGSLARLNAERQREEQRRESSASGQAAAGSSAVLYERERTRKLLRQQLEDKRRRLQQEVEEDQTLIKETDAHIRQMQASEREAAAARRREALELQGVLKKQMRDARKQRRRETRVMTDHEKKINARMIKEMREQMAALGIPPPASRQ